MQQNRIGKITIVDDANVWPHEMETVRSLVRSGYDVELIDSGGKGGGSADIRMGGLLWEMKSPKSGSIKAVERNVKRARIQSENVIIDSRRMKHVPDNAIQKALEKHAQEVKGVSRLLFVNRHGDVIIIK